ncbi:GNAT family N-acetyltransferase [Rubrobacter marinus]|nr:GNAT family N-acetyltransferase [Rubrobacter marinus]
MPEIRTERLPLRGWRESDLDPYARMCSDPEVMRCLPAVLDREGSED